MSDTQPAKSLSFNERSSYGKVSVVMTHSSRTHQEREISTGKLVDVSQTYLLIKYKFAIRLSDKYQTPHNVQVELYTHRPRSLYVSKAIPNSLNVVAHFLPTTTTAGELTYERLGLVNGVVVNCPSISAAIEKENVMPLLYKSRWPVSSKFIDAVDFWVTKYSNLDCIDTIKMIMGL